MFRAFFRLVLILIVIAAAVAFFMGYRFGDHGNDLPRDRPVGTTGASPTVDTTRAREAGAAIGEKVAEGANQAEHAFENGALTTKIKSKMALDDSVKALVHAPAVLAILIKQIDWTNKLGRAFLSQQANVFERYLEPAQGYTESGFGAFVSELRTQTVLFGKPVVLVGGDTHTVRVDKPLTTLYPATCTPTAANTSGTTPSCAQVAGSPTGCSLVLPTPAGATPCKGVVTPSQGNRIQNFTRVEVFGSPDVAWIRAVVDPFDPNVFSFSMQTIAGTGHGRDGFDNDDDLQ